MIPKIIHYCWFGRNEKSGMIRTCIESWKKYMPDYQIMEWNEDNFDVNVCKYTREAYEKKKWAFVSDYVRLYALHLQGGIYFDTDVEVLKSLDPFLSDQAFTGYEVNDCPVTAVLGAEKGNELIRDLLAYYSDKSFINEDGSLNTLTNTIIVGSMLKKYGWAPDGKKKTVRGLVIYPQIFFCPNNISRIWNKPSPKSFTIHHFDSSWTAREVDENTFMGRIKRYVIGTMRNRIGSYKYAELSRRVKFFRKKIFGF